jgi:hypothetical protein
VAKITAVGDEYLLLVQGGDSGQDLALEKFQGGTA